MVGLEETKVREHRAHRVLKCLPHGWGYCSNYNNSPRGRIWICWNLNSWQCVVLHSSSQQITLKASNAGGLQLFLPVVYGSNLSSERTLLWQDLVYLTNTFISGAWVVMGDFNTARFSDEKLGGKAFSSEKLSHINDCINSCQLKDLRHLGSIWSWHNNNIGPGENCWKTGQGLV